MLFGYPIAATAENWLHQCLVDMLTTIHANLGAGAPPAIWPDIIPEGHRDNLRARTGLRNRLEAYRAVVTLLTPAERQRIAACLTKQNRIADLCSCTEDCDALDELPPASHAVIRDLFDFAFSLLGEVGVRDRHYGAIYNATKYHVCPFCGCEYFDAPGAPREDLDHYLPKSRYPFAAANLHNLVPMGMKCNERYKHSQDILRGADYLRRRVFDPYAERTIGISLENSVPFNGDKGEIPDWQIDFNPESAECATWDAVFHFRERICRDVLNPSFKSWLGGFRAWAKSAGIVAVNEAALVQAIDRYAEYLSDLGYADRAFLKASVFRMLREHCNAGNARLIALMYDLVEMSAAA